MSNLGKTRHLVFRHHSMPLPKGNLNPWKPQAMDLALHISASMKIEDPAELLIRNGKSSAM